MDSKCWSGSKPVRCLPEDADPLEFTSKRTLVSWIRGDFPQIVHQGKQHKGRDAVKFRRLSPQRICQHAVQDIFPAFVHRSERLMPGDGRVDGYDKVSAALPNNPAAI